MLFTDEQQRPKTSRGVRPSADGRFQGRWNSSPQLVALTPLIHKRRMCVPQSEKERGERDSEWKGPVQG